MSVYVRWYGKVLEGELLDGEYLGMKQVRIPLMGSRIVALFAHRHVYEKRDHPDLMVFEPRSVKNEKYSVNFQKAAENSNDDVLPMDDREQIEAFKRENWDREHNHLRADKLDEFYQLWRMAMVPFGYVEAMGKRPAGKPQGTVKAAGKPQGTVKPDEKPSGTVAKRLVSDERMEEIRTELKEAVKPRPRREAIQLSLF